MTSSDPQTRTMKHFHSLLFHIGILVFLLSITTFVSAQNQQQSKNTNQREKTEYDPYKVLDTRIDNMKYWRKAAELGLTTVSPQRDVPAPIVKSSKIHARSVLRDDSPDVPVTSQNSTQSENSIFVDPNNPDHVLQSNNSTQNPASTLFGANYFFSNDFGQTWGGSIQGAGGSNSGDPSTAIGLNGRQYVGFISTTFGMGVSYSDNGTSWTQVSASNSSNLDKNHLTIDNSLSSPYQGNVYNAWVNFGGTNINEIEFTRSTNNGESYSPAYEISSEVNAGGHNQGVNLHTGPQGQVYAIWAVYDNWPSDEDAIGFARSINGGISFQPSFRIIDNIRGIRTSGTSKNQRVNSFPAMAVDNSDGPNSGNIYVVWTNIGTPGINSGSDIDIYLIRSQDEGETWSDPIRVNQDEAGIDSEHYFPWISCDPTNGVLSVIFYDDRNVGGNMCETFCANSIDGGLTWEDFRVSDVAFTPSPIPGLADDYMGDYLGISAHSGKVYPVWCDNRSGSVMTYSSPYEINPLQAPENITAEVAYETGEVDLNWQFETVPGFQYFKIYRDDFEIETTTETSFTDNLPDYGVYNYLVTAMHDDGESFGPSAILQWGDGHVSTDQNEISVNIEPDNTAIRYLTIQNVGELDLIYEVTASAEPLDNGKDYCTPSSDCSQGDRISDFAMADISNPENGCSTNGYGDFTDMSTFVNPGETYEVTLGTDYSNQFVTIWIDFDKSSTFDADEMILQDFNLTSAGIFTTDVTIPTGIPSGTTRMRVKDRWQQPSSGDPCEDVNYGETEDYTINVSGWMFMERLVDTLAPGNTKTTEIYFDSNGLEEGPYYGEINITSNDPLLPVLAVPVTLNVGDLLPLSVQAVATPSTICAGEATQLQAIPSGGSGNYSYQWYSVPEGFSSIAPDPVASPLENTTYHVDVNDGGNTITAQTAVVVNNLPETPAMPEGETSLCFGEYQSVYSTDGSGGSSSYLWTIEPESAGSIDGSGLTATVTWDEMFAGSVEISVAGINGCGEGVISEILDVTMNELPTVDLGMDISICANETTLLDAGNPGAQYLWSTGETTQTIVVDTTGSGLGLAEFWVEVTNLASCSSADTIGIYFDDCTGLMEIGKAWDINVSPNPSNGIFNIQINSSTSEFIEISICNLLGNVVYFESSVRAEGNIFRSINMQEKQSGIYFLNVKGNGINLKKKLVIQ